MVTAGFKDSSSFIQTVTNAHILLIINKFENNNERTNIFTKNMKALKGRDHGRIVHRRR